MSWQQPFLAAGDGRLSHDVVLNRGNGRQERVDDAGDFRFGTAPAFGLGGNECRDVEAEGVGCVPLIDFLPVLKGGDSLNHAVSWFKGGSH